MTERERLEKLLLADRDLLLLCDPGEAENVCRLLRDSPAPLADSLGPLVIEPLTKIINTTEGHSAVRLEASALREYVENLERLIRLNPTSASEFADKLWALWLAFIAAMSASRIYHDLPKSRAQKRQAAKQPRKARDPMRHRVIAVLARRRADDCTMQDALNDWCEIGAIDGLQLTYKTRGNYLVEDLDSEDEAQRNYSLRALKKIWTASVIK